MAHLPNCQTIRYKPVPLPAPIDLGHCPVTDARKDAVERDQRNAFAWMMEVFAVEKIFVIIYEF